MEKMRKVNLLLCLLFACLILFGCRLNAPYRAPKETTVENVCENGYFDYYEVPPYDGSMPYVTVNSNVPFFEEADYTTDSYESYGNLDALGRCTVVWASIGKDLMPTEERGSIGSVKPTGWHLVKYDCVDGNYLYNRCHLIGYQLTGENANELNLITGTRYMNVQGMLPFENMVSDYVKETGNHVLYRVTPVFLDNELLARGVLMEGWSVEDEGDGVCFNVFCYNVQPQIKIDYLTGESEFVGTAFEESRVEEDYVLNSSSMKFHYPSCSSVESISERNKKAYTGTREELIEKGYAPCKSCNP
ncbi:MAG: DNA/RNA non-specific endonuclease [Clostridia bacterium]|nr:DNA/RNA non-specific endonuclease [Clostridia bacterium]